MTTQRPTDLLTVRARTGSEVLASLRRAGGRARAAVRDIGSADRLMGEVEAGRSLDRLY